MNTTKSENKVFIQYLSGILIEVDKQKSRRSQIWYYDAVMTELNKLRS